MIFALSAPKQHDTFVSFRSRPRIRILLSFLFVSCCFAQSFKVDATASESPYRIEGQSISNIVSLGDSLVVTSEEGVQLSTDGGVSWQSLETGNSATPLALFADSRGWLWVSYVVDTTIAGQDYLAGKGFSVLINGSWLQLPQPTDPRENFNAALIDVPVTTEINNHTYAIAETIDSLGVTPRRIWAASFAGSLRYIYPDSISAAAWTPRWHVKTPTGEKLNVAENSARGLSQRTFALANDWHRLFVGTANGLYASADHGESFTHISPIEGDENSLSGSFVTSLQFSGGYLYAMALIVNSGESPAMNIAHFPQGMLAENASFSRVLTESRSYVAEYKNGTHFIGNDDGLYVGQIGNFELFNNFKSASQSVAITAPAVFSLNITDKWWIGANDGLAYSSTKGQTWIVFKARGIARNVQKNKHSAVYPSPFQPVHSSVDLNISFRQKQSGTVTVSIYDYAMKKRFSFSEYRDSSSVATLTWDGKTDSGSYLNNGVYFVKIKTPSETFWNKVVVVN